VKLVNGLALDLPSRDDRLAVEIRLAGCGTSACFFPRSADHPAADSAFVLGNFITVPWTL
jgi:hypothetical protein